MSALTVIEGLVIALIAGIMKTDIGWGIAAFIFFIILYNIPVLGETISIVASLIETMIVNEILCNITSNTISWFISMCIFFVFLGIHIALKDIEFDIGIFGYSLIIFEAMLIGVALYLEYSLTWQAIVVPIILIISSVIPFIRIAEYIISVLGTVYVFYIIALRSVEKTYAIVSAIVILLFLIGFYTAAYSSMDYRSVFEKIIIRSKLKKLEKVYPQIKSSQEYSAIFKRCQNDEEKEQFKNDWTAYKLELQKMFSTSPKQRPEELVYSFYKWYDANRRWESTSYYHAYYEEQEYADRRRLEQQDRALRSWKCEFCGRINDEWNSACISCGALRK